jgi:hypothetical protein
LQRHLPAHRLGAVLLCPIAEDDDEPVVPACGPPDRGGDAVDGDLGTVVGTHQQAPMRGYRRRAAHRPVRDRRVRPRILGVDDGAQRPAGALV